MSAEANLAGLYPPTGSQIWNNNLQWQPIPVHVYPSSIDYLTNGGMNPCPAYDKAYSAYLQSDEMKRSDAAMQPFYNYLTSALGTPIADYISVLLVRDTLFVESLYNLT